MVEVERKFRLNNRVVIENILAEAGYQKGPATHQADQVFLLKSDGFATFTPGDPVARLRSVNGSTSLTYKRAINTEGDSIEHEMTVDPAEAAEALLLEMGYKAVTDVDKVRVEYKLEDVTIALDEVKDLGDFIEIEVVCNVGQEGRAAEKIMTVAAQLGLNNDDIEPKKYDQLISERKG